MNDPNVRVGFLMVWFLMLVIIVELVIIIERMK